MKSSVRETQAKFKDNQEPLDSSSSNWTWIY